MEERIAFDVHLRIYLSKKDLVYRTEENLNLLIKDLLHKISKPTFEVLKVNLLEVIKRDAPPQKITNEKLAAFRDKLIEKELVEMKKEKRDVIIDLGSITSAVPTDLDRGAYRSYCLERLVDEDIEIDQILDAETGMFID